MARDASQIDTVRMLVELGGRRCHLCGGELHGMIVGQFPPWITHPRGHIPDVYVCTKCQINWVVDPATIATAQAMKVNGICIWRNTFRVIE